MILIDTACFKALKIMRTEEIIKANFRVILREFENNPH
jgi:hypothetical protein